MAMPLRPSSRGKHHKMRKKNLRDLFFRCEDICIKILGPPFEFEVFRLDDPWDASETFELSPQIVGETAQSSDE